MMKRLVLLGCLALLALPVCAQPALLDAASAVALGTTTTCTVSSYTVSSGTNTALVVFIGASDATEADRAISSVTWNTSESLTAGVSTDGPATSNRRAAIYYLLNPTATTANIVVTFAGTVTSSACLAVSYQNVHQSSPIGDTDGVAAGSGTSASRTLTTTAANSLVLDAISVGLAPTPDFKRQIRGRETSTHLFGGSEWAVTGSGTNQTVGWTFSSAESTYVALELKAAAQPGGNIAFDAAAHNDGTDVTTTVDVSLTVGSGSDRIVLCGAGIVDATDRDVTSISSSVDGAFTLIASVDNPNRKAHLYYLLNPTSGAHTISVDPVDASASFVDMVCASFSGVHQTDPLDGDTTGTTAFADAQTSSSVAQASATDNALAVDIVVGVAQNLFGGAGQTVRLTENNITRVGLSTEPKATAGTITMTWTFASQDYATVMAVLRSTSAAAASPKTKTVVY